MITDLRSKLDRLAARQERTVPKKHDISADLNGEVTAFANGSFIIKRSSFPLEAEYGKYKLENTEKLFFDAERLVFIDTETTGLGAGACPFLIGVAYYENDSLLLEQLFMRDLDDEEAVLSYLISKFSDRTAVSFNGKTFDIPLIKNRCIINSVRHERFACEQIDLLHLSRRIWKKRLQSCRLSAIEEEILKFARDNDINGSLIPELYKSYLVTGSPADIIKIVEHNEKDVVSMTVLLARLLRIENDPVAQLDNINDVMHLGEYYFNQKQYEKAEGCLDAVIHTRTSPLTLYTAMKYLSLINKHNRAWDTAVYYWQKMDRMNIGAIFPLIELAKYYEHTANDLEKALACTKKAYLAAQKANDRATLAEISIRVERLNKKLYKKAQPLQNRSLDHTNGGIQK